MRTNAELMIALQKAGITTDDGGLMPEEVKNKFIDTTVEQSRFLSLISIEKNIKRSRHLDSIGVSSRLMFKREEGTDIENPRGANLKRRTLTPVGVALPYDISLDWLNKNIEGNNAEETVNAAFAKQFRNDLVDLAVNGDTDDAGGDAAFLNVTDGYVKRLTEDVDAHEHDREDGTDWKGTVFPALVRALPEKYRGNKNELAIFVGADVEDEYRDQIGERVTVLGDSFLTTFPPAYYKGIIIVTVPGMPYGSAILTAQKNMFVGFGIEFNVYRQLQPRKDGGIVEFTIHADVDANYAVSDQVAYCL